MISEIPETTVRTCMRPLLCIYSILVLFVIRNRSANMSFFCRRAVDSQLNISSAAAANNLTAARLVVLPSCDTALVFYVYCS